MSFLIVVVLIFLAFNTKLIDSKWLFINTNLGPLRLNSSTQLNLFINELGTKERGLVFIRNRKIESMKSYEAWNPLTDFSNRIVLACKGDKIMGLVNVVYIDVDAERIKLDNNQTKANNFLPNLTTVCLTADKVLNNDKIFKLIDISQGMLIMK